jgi:hypothetical protein
MKLRRSTQHDMSATSPIDAPIYRARHLRDVPVDAEPETRRMGGTHQAGRHSFGILSQLAHADVANA